MRWTRPTVETPEIVGRAGHPWALHRLRNRGRRCTSCAFEAAHLPLHVLVTQGRLYTYEHDQFASRQRVHAVAEPPEKGTET